jgi:hypothetical protein
VQVTRQPVALFHDRQVLRLLEQLHIGNRDGRPVDQRREHAHCIFRDEVWMGKPDIEDGNDFVIHGNREMDEGLDALFLDRGAQIGPQIFGEKIGHDDRLPGGEHLADHPFPFGELHHSERFRLEAVTDARHDLFLFLIPGEDHTAVGVQHVDGHIHESLEYLIETHIAQDLFVRLVERIHLAAAFLERVGAFLDDPLQCTVAVLNGLCAQTIATRHRRHHRQAQQDAEPRRLPERRDHGDGDPHGRLVPDAIAIARLQQQGVFPAGQIGITPIALGAHGMPRIIEAFQHVGILIFVRLTVAQRSKLELE